MIAKGQQTESIFFSPILTASNILGLGWAATPAGLKAMEELAKLEEERREEDATSAQMPRSFETSSEREWKVTNAQELRQSGATSERERKVAGCAKKNMRKRKGSGGIKAMPSSVASNEMCTFLILNISSLQLIPVNVIAYRSQYGSVNPTAIVGLGLLATAVSTGVAIVFCKLMDKRKRRA